MVIAIARQLVTIVGVSYWRPMNLPFGSLNINSNADFQNKKGLCKNEKGVYANLVL